MTAKHARPLALALVALVAAALLSPAGASAARSSVPTVTSVAPLTLAIGDTLTIRGRNFRPGKNKNTVVFKRDGQRAIFVRAREATSTRIRLVVPQKLAQHLSRRKSGGARPTRFRLRVLARRFGRSFTATKLSPVISEAAPDAASPPTGVTVMDPAGTQVTVPVDTDPDCDGDGLRNSVDPDDDNDFLSDALEVSLKLNTCNADTDGDGMTDGWEYQSAVDLNGKGTPYPWKVPYPNALDGGDGGIDFDGDWIPSADEHQAWAQHPGHDLTIAGMWYSAGLKASQDPVAGGCVGMPIPSPRSPFTAEYAERLDRDGNGCLSDNERDEDNDMLGNVEELSGELDDIGWWSGVFNTEHPFTPVTYRGTDWLDADTDGDTLFDGRDDNDFDGFWNAEEIVRGGSSVDKDGNPTGVDTGLWVNPFNPCLPWPDSATCPEYVPVGANPWAPFPDTNGKLPQPRWPLWGEASWPSGDPALLHPIDLPPH